MLNIYNALCKKLLRIRENYSHSNILRMINVIDSYYKLGSLTKNEYYLLNKKLNTLIDEYKDKN